MKQSYRKYFLSALVIFFSACLTAGCGSTSVCYSSEETTITSGAQAEILPEREENDETFYEIYKPYGLTYNQEKGELSFNGELVRCFFDGVYYDEGVSFRCNYFNEKGCVDIHTVRESIDNGDGSIDLLGNLTGIEKSSQKEFEERDLSEFYRSDVIEATTNVSNRPFRLSELFRRQKGFSEIFKKYERLGITYTEPQNGGSRGNVYYNGQLVNAFVDETKNGGVFCFYSDESGSINVQTAYNDRGKLSGVQVTLNPASH